MSNIRAIKALFSISIKQILEKRFDFLASLMVGLFSIAMGIIMIQILFTQVKQLNGWSREEVLFLLGAYRVIKSICDVLYIHSLISLVSIVRNGELDYFITKPVNTQLLVSFRKVSLTDVINVIPGLAIMFYAGNLMHLNFGLGQVLIFVLGSFLGMVILYSLLFIVACLVFWSGQFKSMGDIVLILTEPMSVPIGVYGPVIAQILTFVLPLVFVVTVPVEIFLGKTAEFYLFGGAFAALSSLLVSTWVWNYSLKHYTSASS